MINAIRALYEHGKFLDLRSPFKTVTEKKVIFLEIDGRRPKLTVVKDCTLTVPRGGDRGSNSYKVPWRGYDSAMFVLRYAHEKRGTLGEPFWSQLVKDCKEAGLRDQAKAAEKAREYVRDS